MDGTNNITDDIKKEESRCFVCDVEVQGRFYALATCRTQNSQTRVIEKLGELVGERYMVVISEDDVICRSCAILINTLDRLEIEMRNNRDHVLRFLEQKYSLEDGELRSDGNRPKLCQPPQITKSSAKEIVDYSSKQNEIDLETKKRKNNIYLENSKIQKNSHSWLQCNKCKYTTRLNSFMMYHLRDYVKQRTFCDKCGLCIFEKQDTRHSCIKTNKLKNKENEKDNTNTIVRNESMKTLILEKTLQPNLSLTQTTPPPLIGLSNCDHLYISNKSTCNPTSSKQSMSILQPINMIDIDVSKNVIKSLELNSVQEMEVKIRNESRKQILTLTDDGTVELVEVPCWKET